jgi:hypothetical protein
LIVETGAGVAVPVALPSAVQEAGSAAAISVVVGDGSAPPPPSSSSSVAASVAASAVSHGPVDTEVRFS